MEAAEIDGAGVARKLWSIVIPMARPVLAVVSIFAFVAVWQSYLWPLMVFTDPNKYPLSVAVTQISYSAPLNWALAAIGDVRSVPTQHHRRPLGCHHRLTGNAVAGSENSNYGGVLGLSLLRRCFQFPWSSGRFYLHHDLKWYRRETARQLWPGGVLPGRGLLSFGRRVFAHRFSARAPCLTSHVAPRASRWGS